MFKWLWTLVKAFLIGIFLMSCAAIFLLSGGDEQEEQEVKSIESVQVEEITDPEPVIQETSSEESLEKKTEPENNDIEPEIIYKLTSVLMSPNLDDIFGKDNYEIKYDNEGITLNIWNEGTVDGVVLIINGLGNEHLQQSWDIIKSSVISSCSTWTQEIEKAGVKNPIVMFNVINDRNHDNVLLSVMNGVVIYDATQE